MSRWGICCLGCLLSVVLAGMAAWATDHPVVVQPEAAGYSGAERAAFDDAYQQLTRLLWRHELGPRKRLGEDGWGALDFAAFTAGSLEGQGYETVIVEQTGDGAATRVWVLVALDLGTRTAWIPVEPLPDPDLTQRTLGAVAGVESSGALVLLDATYLTYGRIVELGPNIPPTARIVLPAGDIVAQVQVAWFANASLDPDGTIILYQWTFDEDVQRAAASIAQWHTFASSGTHTISLTVTDNRGAQSSTSLTLYVLTGEEAERDCGCGG
ncbi:PKD domain-containing protein [Candidatus Bipolaricaulota bacterium]